MSTQVRTTCPYCGVGCGVLVDTDAEGGISVRGDPGHPANYGRLCSKGAALAETLGPAGRLLHPQIDGHDCRWDAALDTVARRFQEVIRKYGPESVAFYVSGQLLTEDYYVANKLMKGFIGTANIDTNSRLCMSSAVAGYKRAFGTDTVPVDYQDLEQATLVVITGSNMAWCHPVLYQRLRAAKQSNSDLRVVVIDPRCTSTTDIADLHLAIEPGTDTVLFNGLLAYLADTGKLDPDFVREHTQGLDEALATARGDAPSVESVAHSCGLDSTSLKQFYDLFACTERVVTAFSQGVNQSSSGTDKVNSIINCHLATGRIGRPGAGPFSLTGQPNAMGGREVGGLANQLAAHMELADAQSRERVRRFWNAPHVARAPGLKAVDLFNGVESGRIKAVWIMATNPAVSLPMAERVRSALSRCEFVVVSDCVRHTDTTATANVLLPAQAGGARDGTGTNAERRMSRQRPCMPAMGESKPDWWIVCQVARRMGYGPGFAYEHAAEIFAEHAALSGFENRGERDFDISALQHLDRNEYDRLEPTQWPVCTDDSVRQERLFANGCFFTPTGRASIVAVTARAPVGVRDNRYPLVLNTGRVRDHWHTLTRTGKSARLSAHCSEPYAEIHPHDAQRFGIGDGQLVRVRSRAGAMVARARISPQYRAGSVFVPMHWSDQFASHGRVDALVDANVDPVSGQPESKYTPVSISPYRAAWYGLLLSRHEFAPTEASYWVRSRQDGMWRFELAGEHLPMDWPRCMRRILQAGAEADEKVEWIEYLDEAACRYRGARLVNGRLENCLFVGPDPALPACDHLPRLFEGKVLDVSQRFSVLSGKSSGPGSDGGPLVCACFGVRRDRIVTAVRDGGLDSVEQIGEALGAGTNCGSCVPELQELLRHSGRRSA